jgi:transposase
MLGRGLKARAIAAQLGVSGQSVYNWSVRHEVACRSCPHGNGGDHPCHRVNL